MFTASLLVPVLKLLALATLLADPKAEAWKGEDAEQTGAYPVIPR